jgi:hypothetical protein
LSTPDGLDNAKANVVYSIQRSLARTRRGNSSRRKVCVLISNFHARFIFRKVISSSWTTQSTGLKGQVAALEDVDLPSDWFQRRGRDGTIAKVGTPLVVHIGVSSSNGCTVQRTVMSFVVRLESQNVLSLPVSSVADPVGPSSTDRLVTALVKEAGLSPDQLLF